MPTSDFVPKDYEVPTAGSDFFKLAQGDNKFRALSNAVIGKLGWNENRPFRRGGTDAVIDPSEVDMNDQGKPKIHEFMAFYVWDYAADKIKVAEFTQASIKKELVKYAQDEEWGSPLGYDITITKTGDKLTTKYSFKPSPAKELPAKIKAIVEAAEPTFDLNSALGIDS